MSCIFVLAEHRGGELREISLEMLTAAAGIAQGRELVSVLFGSELDMMAQTLSAYSDRVIYMDDPAFANYNAETYLAAMQALIQEHTPELVLIGQTAQGIEVAPALAVKLDTPFVTDLIDLSMDGETLKPVRSYYQGKLNAAFALRGAAPFLLTLRESSFVVGAPTKEGVIETVPFPPIEGVSHRRFIKYLEAVVGDVDITQAEFLVSVGRGIKEEKNLAMIEELAGLLGATISASRAVVDEGWLPPERQVGTTGKTVKPKVYLAIGISGAFEHTAGMKASKHIIAINKDANAPIFSVATYGIVDDLFQVVPKLIEHIKTLKA